MDDGYILVNNTGQEYTDRSKTELEKRRRGGTGWAKLMDPAKREGRLGVKFTIFQPWYADYLILETDYENFAIVMSKNSFPLLGFLGYPFNYEYYWVLTRKPVSLKSVSYFALYKDSKAMINR